MQTSAHHDAWSRLRLALNDAVEDLLQTPADTESGSDNPEHQQRRLLASRLLLLSDALERMPCSPPNRGVAH